MGNKDTKPDVPEKSAKGSINKYKINYKIFNKKKENKK